MYIQTSYKSNDSKHHVKCQKNQHTFPARKSSAKYIVHNTVDPENFSSEKHWICDDAAMIGWNEISCGVMTTWISKKKASPYNCVPGQSIDDNDGFSGKITFTCSDERATRSSLMRNFMDIPCPAMTKRVSDGIPQFLEDPVDHVHTAPIDMHLGLNSTSFCALTFGFVLC